MADLICLNVELFCDWLEINQIVLLKVQYRSRLDNTAVAWVPWPILAELEERAACWRSPVILPRKFSSRAGVNYCLVYCRVQFVHDKELSRRKRFRAC
jgi:hypothetical protein